MCVSRVLAKTFPQEFDLQTDERLHKFIKKYNGHLVHAIPEIDHWMAMRVFPWIMPLNLEDELLKHELDKFRNLAAEGVDDSKVNAWLDDIVPRLQAQSSFHREFWRCLDILKPPDDVVMPPKMPRLQEALLSWANGETSGWEPFLRALS